MYRRSRGSAADSLGAASIWKRGRSGFSIPETARSLRRSRASVERAGQYRSTMCSTPMVRASRYTRHRLLLVLPRSTGGPTSMNRPLRAPRSASTVRWSSGTPASRRRIRNGKRFVREESVLETHEDHEIELSPFDADGHHLDDITARLVESNSFQQGCDAIRSRSPPARSVELDDQPLDPGGLTPITCPTSTHPTSTAAIPRSRKVERRRRERVVASSMPAKPSADASGEFRR